MPGQSFLHVLKEFVHKHNLIAHGDKIIVSVSGGIDSVVLLEVANELMAEWNCMLAVAHFNHQLRAKESDDDETFVRTLAKAHNLECHVGRADTSAAASKRKLSIQEAARDLRYEFLSELRHSLGFDKIATGHNADDNAETILLNLVRGTGIHGLAGIPAMRQDSSIVRPLLFATREQIQAYAVSRSLRHREDSSNEKTDYTRNFLRHTIIPQIRERMNPNVIGTLSRTGELFRQLEQYLRAEAEQFLSDIAVRHSNEEIVLDRTKLQTKPVFLQEYALLRSAREFTHRDIEFSTVQEMLKISRAETGSRCQISKDAVLCRDRDRLVMKRDWNDSAFRYLIQPNQTYHFDGFEFTSNYVEEATFTNDSNVEYVDALHLGNRLILRSWQNGDSFLPLGMHEKKKVSDLLIEEKIPLYKKHLIPILESDGAIVWICGTRLDDRWKVTSKTTKILKFQYKPYPNVEDY